MDERIAHIVSNITKLEALKQFEINARARNALTYEIRNTRYAPSCFFVPAVVAEKRGWILPALACQVKSFRSLDTSVF